MEKKDIYYLTTPIYYVNDIPHIGHAYTTVAADALARFWRLTGKKVFFLTGTDEHGQKVQQAASSKGLSPKGHADIMVKNFQRLWESLRISNDAFIRTTDEQHKKIVQEILNTLWEKGEIQKRTYTGWYCIPDERFWTEKELRESKCPDCGRPVEFISEDNYFFLMSKYQERLIKYIEENPSYILPETRRNEVLGFLKTQLLGDLCISRPKSRLNWGIELPFDTEYVTYVWFDALLNYYSATKYLAPEGYEWWPANLHIIGKDILITHAVYWSTMLMALELPLPKTIFAHGWWTIEGRKMSKSFGNVVDPHEIINEFGVDAFRYFLLREVPFGLDGDFSKNSLIKRINTDLANDLGNLLNRSLTMVGKYRGGEIPLRNPAKDREWEKRIQGLLGKPDSYHTTGNNIFHAFQRYLVRLEFNKALEYLWSIINTLNEYIQHSAPWKEKDQEILSNILYTVCEGLRIVAIYLYPFMSETAEKIYLALGYENFKISEKDLSWGMLPARQKIKKIPPLFPRIETPVSLSTPAQSEKRAETVTTPQSTGTSPQDQLISIDEFAKVHLKIGKVLQAEKVTNSNKLLRLIVDTGDRHRQIIAGIGKAYEPEALIGKPIVVVTNLKPAKLMGMISEGMLLAAGDENTLSILTVEKDITPGTRVK